MTISLYFNIVIFIIDLKCRSLKLLNDCDIFFESQKFDILSIYAHIVNHNILKIFVKNDLDYIMNLLRKVKSKISINY